MVFVVGVATGITMEFSFGTNWSQYSRVVGDIFGAPLAAEGVLAFFLESSFLGILLFGRKRVSPRVYWLSAFLVFFGSHLSGLWIIIANSWMQTPAGFKMVAGRAVLTDFFAAALNPSTLPRYLHTITSGWITGAFMAAGISAWYLLQKRHDSFAKTTMRVALTLAAVTSLVQLGLGHYHAVQVAETQPAKLAAIEGIFKTQRAAPMVIFGIPNEQTRGMDLAIEVPAMLSLLVGFDVNTEIKGLDSFPAQDRPPVMVPFVTNKLMVALGMFFIGFSWLGLLLMLKGWLWKWPLFLKAMVLAIPLPHLAVQGGWISAEVGRQPWVVYGVLRTQDAASVVVPAGQILFTLIMFAAIYTLLFITFIRLVLQRIRQGPGEAAA